MQLGNRKRVLARLNDPQSSANQNIYSSVGILSAFIIELIVRRDSLKIDRKDKIITLLGGNSDNYPFWEGLIVKSDYAKLKDEDLGEIQEIYQSWWERNREKSIEELRRNSKDGASILQGTKFKWK